MTDTIAINELPVKTSGLGGSEIVLIDDGTQTQTATVDQIRQGLLREVATIAALRSIPAGAAAAQSIVNVSGYWSAGDGGGGMFIWNASSTAADDSGSVIAPTGISGAGRWTRVMGSIQSAKWWGAKGDDVTDDTWTIRAAHDAVKAAGGRYLYFPRGTYYAPNLGQVGDVIFIGEGQLKGAYRKQIIPPTARSVTVPSGVNPAVHLRRFAATANPVVVLFGDSSLTSSDVVSDVESLPSQLEMALRRANPSKAITVHNRAIPGMSAEQMNAKPTQAVAQGYPWYTDPVAGLWLDYVQALAPDLVVWSLGGNDNANLSAVTMYQITQKMKAWAKVPDIILITSTQRSNMTDGVNERAMQEGIDFANGFIRHWAHVNNLGLLDIHRQSVLARDGYDPCALAMVKKPELVGTTATWPYEFADFTSDFLFEFTAPDGPAVFSGGKIVSVNLSNKWNNYALLSLNANNTVKVAITAGDGLNWSEQTQNTAYTVQGGVLQFRFQLRRNHLMIHMNWQLVFSGFVPRYGGLFRPFVGWLFSSATLPITINRVALSHPVPTMPYLTDSEAYGTPTDPNGGNDVNHSTSPAYATVHQTVLDLTDLRAAPTLDGIRGPFANDAGAAAASPPVEVGSAYYDTTGAYRRRMT